MANDMDERKPETLPLPANTVFFKKKLLKSHFYYMRIRPDLNIHFFKATEMQIKKITRRVLDADGHGHLMDVRLNIRHANAFHFLTGFNAGCLAHRLRFIPKWRLILFEQTWRTGEGG